MRILSIDPGSNYMGWAVYEANEEVILLTHGCEVFKGTYDAIKSVAIGSFISRLICTYAPAHLVVETYFVQGNSKGAGVVTEVRGIIRYIWGMYSGKDIDEMHPGTVKLQCTGRGDCSKEELKSWVENYYNITIKVQDEGDAICIGYTFLKLHGSNV
jgi:Holliday junction resolvasome RuvABC endonuclease subunit